jgi:hypothetical protein
MPVHLTGSTHDVAWTMTRVSVETYASNANLRLGLTILFLFAVLSGAWLWHLRHRWSNQVGQLEQAIAAFPLEQLPHIRETGERESSDENDIAAIYPNISLYYYWDKYGTDVMRVIRAHRVLILPDFVNYSSRAQMPQYRFTPFTHPRGETRHQTIFQMIVIFAGKFPSAQPGPQCVASSPFPVRAWSSARADAGPCRAHTT